ncbi:myocardin-related transcription factor B [Coccinella septempunctata]|uniref:myocardin-related transcription factor B n=1 Tax=Coccinella septempunctata TaxID=41139 RepID=UPI001D05FF3F|nr:myocardin-related transcription factor B [Coccinella septempunctata]
MGLTNTDILKLKVPELKKELKLRGLNTTGNKNDLLERLQEALKSPEMSSGSLESDILEDDLLNDDDDEHHNTSETVIDSDVEKVLEESSVTLPNLKHESPISESSNGIEKKAKKIKLQRDIPSLDETQSSVKPSVNSSSENSQPKVIKLTGMSFKERLEMRAKKFGVELPGSAKLLARAERFGALENSSEPSEIEKLKRRAERFGGSVAKTMTKLEMKEKLEARKARFAASK